MYKLTLLLFLIFICNALFPCPIPTWKQNLTRLNGSPEKCLEINWSNIPTIIVFGLGLVSMCWLTLLHVCNHVKYVSFNTDLTLVKKSPKLVVPYGTYFSVFILGLLFSEFTELFLIKFRVISIF